jgi:ribosome-associated translation inhibitor RaiA
MNKDKRVPSYYIGKNGYEARKVCDNFDLTYHLGTAVTYILRAYHKHKTPVECIKKAIAHLEFELEKVEEKPSINKIIGGKL